MNERHHERKRAIAYRIVCVALIGVHAVMLGINAWRLSPVLDEYGHLYAGVRLWRDFDTSIFCVNPPLVRAIAGAPGYLMGVETIEFVQASMRGREEFPSGRLAYRRDPERFIDALRGGRWAVSSFSLAGLVLMLVATRRFYGRGASLVCGSLWAFQSEWIAHGSLLTNDVAVSVGMLAAALTFLYWLKSPSAAAAFAAGSVFAVALLCKFSAASLLPIFAIVALVCRPVGWWSWLGHTMVFTLTAWGLFCAAYGFSDVGRPLGSFLFTSPGLQGDVTSESIAGNVFKDTIWARVPVPLPADAVVGVDVQMRDMQIGAPSFMAGRRGSAWWFYLYALAVKLPLGTWLAVATTLGVLIRRRHRMGVDEVLLLAFVYLFLVITAVSFGIGQHHRYAFPVLGPLIFLVGFGWYYGRRFAKSLVLLGTVATAAFCLVVAPNWMAAFNLAAGGMTHGHRLLFNDATDWGQDLQRLADLASRQPANVRVVVLPLRHTAANLGDAGMAPRVDVTRRLMEVIKSQQKATDGKARKPLRVICSKSEVSMDRELREFVASRRDVVDLWGSHLMFDVPVGKADPAAAR